MLAEIVEGLSQIQKTENFKFLHLLSVINDADESGISDECFRVLIEHMIGFVEVNKQAIRYSLDKELMSFEGEEEG